MPASRTVAKRLVVAATAISRRPIQFGRCSFIGSNGTSHQRHGSERAKAGSYPVPAFAMNEVLTSWRRCLRAWRPRGVRSASRPLR